MDRHGRLRRHWRNCYARHRNSPGLFKNVAPRPSAKQSHASTSLDVSDAVDLDQRIAWNAGGRCNRGAHRREIAPVEAAINRVHTVIILEVVQIDVDLQAFL